MAFPDKDTHSVILLYHHTQYTGPYQKLISFTPSPSGAGVYMVDINPGGKKEDSYHQFATVSDQYILVCKKL